MDPKNVRHMASLGTFYPIDQGELIQLIETGSSSLLAPEELLGKHIKAILTPCIPFEGNEELLSSAYSTLVNSKVDEVFLFSDCLLHRFDYIAFADYIIWETPLGAVDITHRLEKIVHSDDSFKDLLKVDNSMHQGEISLECQLPFLQEVFEKNFKIVPFMVGNTSPRLVTNYLSGIIDKDDLLVCVSNISTGLPGDFAKDIDEISNKAILNLDLDYLEKDNTTISAPKSVSLLCSIAKHMNWKPYLIDYSVVNIPGHLSDTQVGASSFVFYED